MFLLTTDFILNLHQSPFEFDFSRVTIFGLTKFQHFDPPGRNDHSDNGLACGITRVARVFE